MRHTSSLILALLVLSLAATAVLAQDDARLLIRFTNFGEPLEQPDHARFYIYELEKRTKYVGWGHGAKPARVPEGVYDIVIRYTNDKIVKEIERTEVELIGTVEEEVEFEIPIAHLTVDITSGQLPIGRFTGNWAVYRSGKRGTPLARKRPGETLTIRPGNYDVEINYRDDAGLRTSWLENYYLEDERHEQVEMGGSQARITLTMLDDGRPIGSSAGVWRIYPPGERAEFLAERASGDTLAIEPGAYDIGIVYIHPDEEEPSQHWLSGVEVAGHVSRQVEMGGETADDIGTPVTRQTTSLTVTLSHRDERLSGAWCNVYRPGRRRAPLRSAVSGEKMAIEPGKYDIGCFLRDGGTRAESWLEQSDLKGNVTLDVELDPHPAYLRIVSGRSRRRSSIDSKLLIVLDGSSNMQAKVGGTTRFDMTRAALREIIPEQANASVQIGLRTYGAGLHGGEGCGDSSLAVPPDEFNTAALMMALEYGGESGSAPLAYSLAQVEADLQPQPGNALVLITGSLDTCGGDPCREIPRLIRAGAIDRSYVIAVGLDHDARRELDCVGEYHAVRNETELKGALRAILSSVARMDKGTVSLFGTGQDGGLITGGFVGEKIQVSAGSYDIAIRAAGKSYFWTGVEVEGNIEAPVGRRAP